MYTNDTKRHTNNAGGWSKKYAINFYKLCEWHLNNENAKVYNYNNKTLSIGKIIIKLHTEDSQSTFCLSVLSRGFKA